MRNIDCKNEVLKVYPNAVYMHFEATEIKHHIRDYSGDIPITLGKGISENAAWIGAYLTLKSQNKL